MRISTLGPLTRARPGHSTDETLCHLRSMAGRQSSQRTAGGHDHLRAGPQIRHAGCMVRLPRRNVAAPERAAEHHTRPRHLAVRLRARTTERIQPAPLAITAAGRGSPCNRVTSAPSPDNRYGRRGGVSMSATMKRKEARAFIHTAATGRLVRGQDSVAWSRFRARGHAGAHADFVRASASQRSDWWTKIPELTYLNDYPVEPQPSNNNESSTNAPSITRHRMPRTNSGSTITWTAAAIRWPSSTSPYFRRRIATAPIRCQVPSRARDHLT